MALSRSLEKAQTFALCQWCKESSDIKWKCINCDLFLCQLCNSKIHSKNETLRDHKFINLKECGTDLATETIRKVDLKKLVCSSHDDKKCVVYCTDCTQPICDRCLIHSHKNHTFNELDDVYKMKEDEIKDMKSKLESDLSFFNQEEDNLRQLLLDGDKMYIEAKNKILEREKEIKEAATKHAQELIQELDSQWKPSETEIKKELSEVTKNKNDLQDRKQNLDQALQSHQATEIFSTSNSLDKSLPQKSIKKIKLKATKFLPTNITINIQSKSETFGELYKEPELELELVQTYQTELRHVTNILHCKDNITFISSKLDKVIQKVQFDNTKSHIIKESKTYVYDMAMMSNGDILLSSGGELKLYSNNDIKTFKTFSPLWSLGVHVSEHNEIIVGLTDSSPFRTPTSVRKVIVLNQCGDLQHSYEFDRDNQRLFTLPWRICTCNDNICVVDILNDKSEGRVVVLNKEGQIEWVYNRDNSADIDKNKIFPRDITISNNELILISDKENHAIHVLNQQGELIMCSVVKYLGIELPYSLDIDKDRMLWIGCSTKDANNAKIHRLQMK